MKLWIKWKCNHSGKHERWAHQKFWAILEKQKRNGVGIAEKSVTAEDSRTFPAHPKRALEKPSAKKCRQLGRSETLANHAGYRWAVSLLAGQHPQPQALVAGRGRLVNCREGSGAQPRQGLLAMEWGLDEGQSRAGGHLRMFTTGRGLSPKWKGQLWMRVDTPKAMTLIQCLDGYFKCLYTKENDHWTFIKIKNFCSSKDTVRIIKRQVYHRRNCLKIIYLIKDIEYPLSDI